MAGSTACGEGKKQCTLILSLHVIVKKEERNKGKEGEAKVNHPDIVKNRNIFPFQKVENRIDLQTLPLQPLVII